MTFPTTPILDVLNRTENPLLLGGAWGGVIFPGDLALKDDGTTAITMTNYDYGSAVWMAQPFTNCEAYFTVPVAATGTIFRLHVRVANPNTSSVSGYLGFWNEADNTCAIARVDSGTVNYLVDVAHTIAGGDVLGISAVGSALAIYSNGTVITSTTDGVYQTGLLGISTISGVTGQGVNNFGGGAVGMIITNQTNVDYWIGPMHLPAGYGQTLRLDDTSATALYLIDDTVADMLNTLVQSGMVTVANTSAPFPRPTGVPKLVHGNGSPNGLVYAGQGSLYLRRDNAGPSTALYTKTSGVTFNNGWSIISTAQHATYQETVASAATGSASEVMAGLAGAITPAVTGSVMITISGVWKNTAGANTMTYGIYTGTGTAPANGVAVPGTATLQSALPQATSTGASVNIPFSIQAMVTGLTVGTAYWIDLAFNASAGTSTISGVTVSATEI